MATPTPSHSDVLGAFIELDGDLSAIRARFSLSGVELLAFLEDDSFRTRLNNLDAFLTRSTIKKLQSISAEAFIGAITTGPIPIEVHRASTNLARLASRWGQLPSAPRTRSARPSPAASPVHSSHAAGTSTHPFPAAGAPTPNTPVTIAPIATPAPPFPRPPLNLSNILDRSEIAKVPQPLPPLTNLNPPNSPSIKLAPHLSLLAKAGQAPAIRASGP